MFIVVLLLLAQRVSASTSSTLALSGPPRPVAVGDGADYVCTQNNINGDIQWIINNMPLEDLNLPNVQTTSLTGRGFLLFNDLSVNFNETTVQCKVNNSGTIIYSNINELLVQGPPSAVGSLSATTLNPYTISLTWTPSFTLNILNPDITYCVNVEVNITASSSVTRSECDITTNAYNYTINPSEVCGFYRFTLTPINRLGNGPAVTHTHLMESSIGNHGQLEPTSIVEKIYSFKILLSGPACVSHLIFYDIDTGENSSKNALNLNISGRAITFTDEGLRKNRFYNVTVNATNILTSAMVILSTHGIRNISSRAKVNGLHITINYFTNSSTRGVILIFLCINTNGFMDFIELIYLPLDRNGSHEHRVSPGSFLVLAYDIESDGTLLDGVSYPASTNNLPISGSCRESPQSAHNSEECDVTIIISTISAQCNDSYSNLTGFQMIVQSTSFMYVRKLLINHTTDSSSPVEVEVEQDGEYLVTVYSIKRGRGIVHDSTPHQQRIIISTVVITQNGQPTSAFTLATTDQNKAVNQLTPIIIGVVTVFLIIFVLLGIIFLIIIYKQCKSKSIQKSDIVEMTSRSMQPESVEYEEIPAINYTQCPAYNYVATTEEIKSLHHEYENVENLDALTSQS